MRDPIRYLAGWRPWPRPPAAVPWWARPALLVAWAVAWVCVGTVVWWLLVVAATAAPEVVPVLPWRAVVPLVLAARLVIDPPTLTVKVEDW